MKSRNIPALLLAIGLQLVPICRVILVAPASAPPAYAIVLKWLAGAVALLGTYHAVSGASAAIAGVANTSPAGPVTLNATGTVGQAFSYRIIVTNPGVNPNQAYWNAAPLPPGLMINTNIGGNGWITGTPTTGGSYPVTLTAGNANSDIVVHKAITIDIQGGASPPLVTGPPTDQAAAVGANVSFTVTASGSGLSYVWLFAGTNIAGATGPTLSLVNVQRADAGVYTVVVSNASGAVTNSAQLTVNAPLQIVTLPQSQIVAAGATVTLAVTATGSGLTYQWRFNQAPLAQATSPTLTLTQVTPAQSGLYSVMVSNSTSQITSPDAQLLVVPPPSPAMAPVLTATTLSKTQLNIGFTTTAGYRYLLQSSAGLGTNSWITLTNVPPAFTNATFTLPLDPTVSARQFFRLQVQGN